MKPNGKLSCSRLVFELGTEELPPGAAWGALRQLYDNAVDLLGEARIHFTTIKTYATPRRLTLVADGIPVRQEDLVKEVRGPAVQIAFDSGGKPTKAAEAFARSQGVSVKALERRTTPQGQYVYATRRQAGVQSIKVLSDILPRLAERLAFSKTMRWTSGPMRFARPIRWVLALLGRRVVRCDLAGLRGGRITSGHRFLSPKRTRVQSADVYEKVLQDRFVLVDPEARQQRIISECRRVAHKIGGQPILDQDLVKETVQLVEWPVAFTGRFADEFLDLPEDVLVTVMQHHQKYFAIRNASGSLLPAFVVVRNGDTRGLETVREGNEWVLHARLADARFFFEEDRKRPLASRVQELQDLVFLEQLGTMRDKTQRLEALGRRTSTLFNLTAQAAGELTRAAQLSKADLLTLMVRELPELQGVMGGIYARRDGESETVARAIGEQYLPRGARWPQSDVGACLALLDKADTLLGALASGISPSGSEDPYGLRRAATGIVTVILARGLRLSLRRLAEAVLDVHHIEDAGWRTEAIGTALEMLRQRLRSFLIERNVTYDTIDAVLASGMDDLVDAEARVGALAVFRHTPEFLRLYTAYDRASRILPSDFVGRVNEQLITTNCERELLSALLDVEKSEVRQQHYSSGIVRNSVTPGKETASAVANQMALHYNQQLGLLASLADPVDRFFTDVLVMDPDPAVRNNRLALLAGVVNLIRPIADLSRVVIGEGKPAAAQ